MAIWQFCISGNTAFSIYTWESQERILTGFSVLVRNVIWDRCLSEWSKSADPLQKLLIATMVQVKGTAQNSSHMLSPKGKMYASN